MQNQKNSAETVTLRLEPAVKQAAIKQAHKERREVGEYLTYLVTDGLLRAGAFADNPVEETRLRLREQLVSNVVAKAVQIHERDGHRRDITAAACAAAVAEPAWRAEYERFIEADAFAKGVELKARINPRIGARIKAALGLQSAKRADGKADTYAVQDAIIQQATFLEPAE